MNLQTFLEEEKEKLMLVIEEDTGDRRWKTRDAITASHMRLLEEVGKKIEEKFREFDGADYSNFESVAEIVQDATHVFKTDVLALLSTKEK